MNSKTLGIVERIKSAANAQILAELLNEMAGYDFISPATEARARRAARVRAAHLKSLSSR